MAMDPKTNFLVVVAEESPDPFAFSNEELLVNAILGKTFIEISETEFRMDRFIFRFSNEKTDILRSMKNDGKCTRRFPRLFDEKINFVVSVVNYYTPFLECFDVGEDFVDVCDLYSKLDSIFVMRNVICHSFCYKTERIDSDRFFHFIKYKDKKYISDGAQYFSEMNYRISANALREIVYRCRYVRRFISRLELVLDGEDVRKLRLEFEESQKDMSILRDCGLL